MTREDYDRMLKEIEDLKAEAQRAQGAIAVRLEQLRKLGYKTEREARAALPGLEAEIARLESEVNEALGAYHEAFSARIPQGSEPTAGAAAPTVADAADGEG